MEHTDTLPASGRASEFRAGFLAVVPLWLGAAPFGALYAVSARAAGLDAWQTLAMSLFVFAGAAQFTAVGLFAAGAPGLAIVLTTLMVNARHVLMGASIAHFLGDMPHRLRLLIAALLTDETYAVGIRRFLDGRGTLDYMLGANISLYLLWQASTAAGILAGALIPDPAAYGLDLIFPLTFIGLLAPLVKTRVNAAVAGIAGAVALAGALLLPGKWYLLLAGLIASACGALIEWRRPQS